MRPDLEGNGFRENSYMIMQLALWSSPSASALGCTSGARLTWVPTLQHDVGHGDQLQSASGALSVANSVLSARKTAQTPAWFLFVWAAFALVLGSVNLTRPELTWRMRRWQFKNPEAVAPSNVALTFARVIGGVFVVFGVVVLVIAISKLL
jgi:hypothetical protein